MSREIKFRAWDKKDHVIRSWDDLLWMIYQGEIDIWCDKHLEIMQFTGLHDRNGKEIWEGDILWTRMGKTKIQFVMEWDEKEAQFTRFAPQREYEVIGNVYENPELLEKTGKEKG